MIPDALISQVLQGVHDSPFVGHLGVTRTKVERQNQTLQAMLAAFVSTRSDDWDLFVDPVVYAYNTSRQESIGVSPYEVVFGRLPRVSLE